MKGIIAVFIGSGIGGVMRYVLGRVIQTYYSGAFPLATLLINIFACLLLGVIIGYLDYKQLLSSRMQLFWATGICGGFSTFSTFSSENLTLYREGHYALLLLYVGLSVLLCFCATFGGLYLSQRVLN
ncbi:MAG: fluoride efflux transporter CrcB [Bacteroidota bacterium]